MCPGTLCWIGLSAWHGTSLACACPPALGVLAPAHSGDNSTLDLSVVPRCFPFWTLVWAFIGPILGATQLPISVADWVRADISHVRMPLHMPVFPLDRSVSWPMPLDTRNLVVRPATKCRIGHRGCRCFLHSSLWSFLDVPCCGAFFLGPAKRSFITFFSVRLFHPFLSCLKCHFRSILR